MKSWLIGKDPDAGRDWGQEEKGMTEDEMAGWHHWLDGRESEWTPGVGDGQGGLACCNSWGHKESDMTERLNWISSFRYYLLTFSYGSLLLLNTSHSLLRYRGLPILQFFYFLLNQYLMFTLLWPYKYYSQLSLYQCCDLVTFLL